MNNPNGSSSNLPVYPFPFVADFWFNPSPCEIAKISLTTNWLPILKWCLSWAPASLSKVNLEFKSDLSTSWSFWEENTLSIFPGSLVCPNQTVQLPAKFHLSTASIQIRYEHHIQTYISILD